MNLKGIKSVLFICMGNICRSPSAEAVFRKKAKDQGLQLKIDSAGTVGAHVREKPDHRAQKVGAERGYSFDGIKARKVTAKDFEDFDLILAIHYYHLPLFLLLLRLKLQEILLTINRLLLHHN